MKTRFHESKIAATHTFRFAAILVTGLLLYEPLGTAIFLLGMGVGSLIYLVARDESAATDE